MRVLILAVPLFISGCLTDYTFVDSTVEVQENLSLSGDVVKTKYTISTPGVVLEGNGYAINGKCNSDCVGLVIRADNVVVRNVTITGFDGGVSIQNGVTGVRFENVTIKDNVQHGVYVDKNVSKFSCLNCTISDNGSMGIYFEYNTHGNTIKDSVISFNGFRDKDTGNWFDTQKNKKKDKREGIAIDASQGNFIDNTDFFGNALAAVTLYRNCGERGVRREWGASYNIIRGGNFSDDILIASRQDKDLSKWGCSEPYVLSNKYVMDDAEYNVIDGITLSPTTRVIVRDDNNTVTGVTGGRLIAKSAVREQLQMPLTGLGIDYVNSTYEGDPAFLIE